jgi:hypothetical protein
MQRTSVVAEIFGYLICLISVAIFFLSVAGIVSSVFRIAHPTPYPYPAMRRVVATRPGGSWAGPMVKAPQAPGALPGPTGLNRPFMSDRLIADARYDAVRRFVLAVVMLILSLAVFNRAFGWLNPKQGPAT